MRIVICIARGSAPGKERVSMNLIMESLPQLEEANFSIEWGDGLAGTQLEATEPVRIGLRVPAEILLTSLARDWLHLRENTMKKENSEVASCCNNWDCKFLHSGKSHRGTAARFHDSTG
jgi:hypothetical protein